MTNTLDRYVDLLGEDQVLRAGPKASGYLRDFSWYSPILENALADTTVDAVLRPRSLRELEAVVALAAANRTPITLRGAGTGNYGQSLPLRQGLVVDVKGVAGVLEVSDGRVAVLPGTLIKDAEAAANATGQELAVMPSTYRVATAAGFICGGSGGLGAAVNGDLWDDNILAVEILTVEEEPRTIRLEGDDVRPILHTYGTIGVVTRVEFRLVPAHEYTSAIALFDTFADAAAFGQELVLSDVHARLVSVQQAPIGSMFTPLRAAVGSAHTVLIWVDESDVDTAELAVTLHGGRLLREWPTTTHISQFPFSHTILWSRKADPASSWLQCEYSSDPDTFLAQVIALEERYAGVFLQHIEFALSSGRARPLGIPPLIGLPDHEDALDELITFCTELGMTVLNPHSYVVSEGGFVGDTARVVELKTGSDPYDLLNPGKLSDSFFTSRGLTPPSARRRRVAQQ